MKNKFLHKKIVGSLISTALLFLMIVFLTASSNEPLVAEFGKNRITLEEFKTAYLDVVKKPKVFDSKQLREDFLDELIRSRLLAIEAKRLGYDKNELYSYKVDSYRDKCLRDVHYEKVIKPKIKITEKDVEEVYQFSQEERKINHLFVETKSEADTLYQMLEKGFTFEELAKNVFKDSLLANSGGNLGWVYWDQLDYDLAMAAFRQPLNAYSKPVRSQFGYHIVKVTDFKKKPLITRSEYEVHRRKAKYLLEYKIGEKYSYEYINKMLKNSKTVVYSKVLSFVQEKLAQKLKRKPTPFDQMNELQLREEEVKYIETNLWDERNQIMAIVEGKNYTIGNFIGALNYIPYEIIYSSFKKTFDFALRDFILTEEAKKLGLQKSDKVQLKTKLYSEFLLQLELRKNIVGKVTVNENDLKKFYEDNHAKFKEATFEQLHDTIKDIVINQKKRDAVPEYLKSLIKNVRIKKNLSLIHSYYDA
ncbi:MAG: peptidylprolyl isomerase, partial [Bacteroidota bacterium]